jgi:hypothetical protein
MQALSLATNTLASRSSQSRSFQQFCRVYGFVAFPAAPDTLVLYCAHLALVRGLAEPSIRNYLSAVRQDHLAAGVELPTPSSYHPLQAALRGAKRLLSRPVRQKLPVSPSLIARLVAATDWGSPLRCLFLLLWLTFSRLASIIPSSRSPYSPRLHLAWRHVTINHQGVTIVLNTTKTIQCQERQLTFMIAPHGNPSICLWTQLGAWRSSTPFLAPDAAVFLALDRRGYHPLTRLTADPGFRAALSSAGAPVGRYGWSSFRRGGATSFFLATGDIETLRVQGDWASSAYRRYLAVPARSRARVASTMQDLIQ